MKKIALAAAAVLMTTAAAWLPMEAHAQVGFSLEVGNAPPPERYEIIPPPRYGCEWVRGFWDWNGREYVWVPGYWVVARDGYFYDAPRWFLYDGRWRLERGGYRQRPPDWNYHHPNPPPRPLPPPSRPMPPRDRDHDGIPDYRDRDSNGNGIPDNREPVFRNNQPGRGDQDRDGVPNRYDRDRDGDRVPNRYDQRPNDPRRN